MTDFYDNNNYDEYETEDNAKSVTETIMENTIIEENLNTPDSANDNRTDNAAPAESKETSKPKKSENKNTPAAPKARKTEAEKLAALKEQEKKLTNQRTDNRKKGKELDNQLADVKAKIHTAEISRLEEVCGKLNITIPDLTAYLEKLPSGKKLSYGDFGNLPPNKKDEV